MARTTDPRGKRRRAGALARTAARMAALAVALLVVASCSSDEAALVGLWSGACSDSPSQTFSGEPFMVEFDDDASYVIQQAGGSSRPDRGRFTLAGEQVILTGEKGATMTGGYAVNDTELRLSGLVDPDSRHGRPYWCALTLVHS